MSVYFVDYESGDDGNNGTATSTPWKHCPGDTNATGFASSTTPVANDIVYFKKGVRYQGNILLKSSGTAGNQITYSGNPDGWGVGEAIIDGSTTLTWNACTGNGPGATEVRNANYASIHYATLPAGANWEMPVIENGKMLDFAGTENYGTPFFFEDTDYWLNSLSGVTSTSIQDATNFDQADSDYWNGAVAMVHLAGNSVGRQLVTGFTPSTNTVTFADIGTPSTTGPGGSYEYMLINAQTQLAEAGQVAVDEGDSIIYCWPTSDIADVRVGSLPYGFHLNSKDFNTIEHLVFEGQYDDGFEFGRAITGSTSVPVDGAVVDNCTFRNIEVGTASGALAMDSNGTGGVVSNCNMSRIRGGRGIILGGSNQVIEFNTFEYVSGTVVFSLARGTLPNVDGVIRGNRVDSCFGVHANVFSVYGRNDGGTYYEAQRWLIDGNIVTNSIHSYGDFDFSAQAHKDFDLINNVFEGNVICDQIRPGGNYYRLYNNTIVGYVRIFSPENVTECVVKNNFINEGILKNDVDDWSDIEHSYNAYVTLTSQQTPVNGWALGEGEFVSTSDLTDMFTSPSGDDYTLKAGSVLIGAGTDLSTDFTTDVLGVTRTVPWDIGAYAYDGPAPPTTPPNAPTDLTLTAL